MLILKRFSGLLKGVSYIDAQVGKVGNNHPIVEKSTRRARKQVQGFTKPIIKILKEK